MADNNKPHPLLSGLIIILLTQCANPVVPSGGNKDITPPKVIHIAHEQTKKSIITYFTFDEQVVPGNTDKTVILSPASLNKIEVSTGNRSISITIDQTDPLKADSYLQLLPGWAQDLNEKNKADSIPFHYIMSSHPEITDSNVIQSKIQPISNASRADLNIYLFDSGTHNKSFIGKPFTKTDKEGNFMFPSLAYSAMDQYILLDDLNKNHAIDSNEYYCLYPVNKANKNNKILSYSYPLISTKLKFENDSPLIRVTGLRGNLITNPQFYTFNYDTGFLYFKSGHVPQQVKDLEGRTHQLILNKIPIKETLTATQYISSLNQIDIKTSKPIESIIKDTAVVYLSDSTYVLRVFQLTSTNGIKILNIPENAIKLKLNPNSIRYETGDSNANLSISIQPKALIYATITLQKNKDDSNQYLVFFAKDGILNKQIIKSNQDMISTQLPLGKYDAIIVLDSDKNTRYSLSDINIMKLEEPTAIKKGVQITDKIENTLILDRFSLFPFMSPTR